MLVIDHGGHVDPRIERRWRVLVPRQTGQLGDLGLEHSETVTVRLSAAQNIESFTQSGHLFSGRPPCGSLQ